MINNNSKLYYLTKNCRDKNLKNFIEFQHIVFLCFSPFNSLITEDKLEVTNARKLLPPGQNFGLGCSKSGYNPWIVQK